MFSVITDKNKTIKLTNYLIVILIRCIKHVYFHMCKTEFEYTFKPVTSRELFKITKHLIL